MSCTQYMYERLTVLFINNNVCHLRAEPGFNDHVNWRGKVYETQVQHWIARPHPGPQKLHSLQESLLWFPPHPSHYLASLFQKEWKTALDGMGNKLEKLGSSRKGRIMVLNYSRKE